MVRCGDLAGSQENCVSLLHNFVKARMGDYIDDTDSKSSPEAESQG